MEETLCRLCLGSSDLIWLFDESKKHDNLSEIILTTCGVNIQATDVVSQWVCGTCCQIAVKMYRFRSKAQNNDNDLKARQIQKVILNETRKKEVDFLQENPARKQSIGPSSKSTHVSENKKAPPKELHPSLKSILSTHPNIKLPESFTRNANYNPSVRLQNSSVDEYFRALNYATEDIENMKKDCISDDTTSEGHEKVQEPEAPENQDVDDDDEDIKPIHRFKRIRLITETDDESSTKSQEVIDLREVSPLKITLSKIISPTDKEHKSKKRRLEARSVVRPLTFNEDVSHLSSLDSATMQTDSEANPTTSEKAAENTKITEEADANNETVLPARATPDSSDQHLLSDINKTAKLFTCKVCNSPYYSLKELRNHERRIHTKCPFCSKRFKTIVARDEHVKNGCDPKKMPVVVRCVRIQLPRVDKVPNVREQYPYAFTSESESDSADVINFDSPVAPPQKPEQSRTVETPKKDQQVVAEQETVKPPESSPTDKFAELKQYLQLRLVTTNDKSTDKAVPAVSKTPETVNPQKTPRDVICISDEESDETPTPTVPARTSTVSANTQTLPAITENKYQIVNNALVPNVDADDSELVRKIFAHIEQKNNKLETSTVAIEKLTIVNGDLPRTIVFNGLQKELYKYMVPVEINFSQNLSASYKTRTQPVNPTNAVFDTRNSKHSWIGMKAIDLELPKTINSTTSAPAVSVPPQNIILNRSSMPLNHGLIYNVNKTSQDISNSKIADLTKLKATQTTKATDGPIADSTTRATAAGSVPNSNKSNQNMKQNILNFTTLDRNKPDITNTTGLSPLHNMPNNGNTKPTTNANKSNRNSLPILKIIDMKQSTNDPATPLVPLQEKVNSSTRSAVTQISPNTKNSTHSTTTPPKPCLRTSQSIAVVSNKSNIRPTNENQSPTKRGIENVPAAVPNLGNKPQQQLKKILPAPQNSVDLTQMEHNQSNSAGNTSYTNIYIIPHAIPGASTGHQVYNLTPMLQVQKQTAGMKAGVSPYTSTMPVINNVMSVSNAHGNNSKNSPLIRVKPISELS